MTRKELIVKLLHDEGPLTVDEVHEKLSETEDVKLQSVWTTLSRMAFSGQVVRQLDQRYRAIVGRANRERGKPKELTPEERRQAQAQNEELLATLREKDVRKKPASLTDLWAVHDPLEGAFDVPRRRRWRR